MKSEKAENVEIVTTFVILVRQDRDDPEGLYYTYRVLRLCVITAVNTR